MANEYSPLDVTDLVQIDAMNTGYSRPAKGHQVTEFTGDRNDIAMFGEFIRDYLDKYQRWQSPKYLFGESYGTYRSAGLASELQSNEGIELNGIMLLGTVLDFQYISPSPTNDIGYAAFLPTYATTAWYHKKLSPEMEKESVDADCAGGADLRVRRLPDGAGEGERTHRRGAERGGAEGGVDDRRVVAVRAQYEPADRRRHRSAPSCCATSARWWGATTAA